MTPLDFYLQFIREIKKCSRCGEVLESAEQVQQHCQEQPCKTEKERSTSPETEYD